MKRAWFLWLFALPLWAQSEAHRKAVSEYGRKNFAAAAALFRTLLPDEKPGTPEHAESTLLLGQSLYLLGRTSEAIPVLEQAPPTNEALYMLGNSRLKKRDIPGSVAAFGRMFGAAPDSAAAHLITAQIMMREELNGDAEGQLLQAIALEPKLPMAHFLLGEIYLFQGDAGKAVEELGRELAINPASATAYYKLGDAYSRQGQWAKAIGFLQKSVWLDAANSGPYILLGKGYLQGKEFGNAEGVLRRALQMDPQNASAAYLLGQTLMQEGKTEEGRAMLQESQRLKK